MSSSYRAEPSIPHSAKHIPIPTITNAQHSKSAVIHNFVDRLSPLYKDLVASHAKDTTGRICFYPLGTGSSTKEPIHHPSEEAEGHWWEWL
ncbi:hypothetical protein TNCT_134911 [Trichonephila clavata]|uniref:Uncharacterized protein n=1 Tax=Trichonephila clavata TaxID=2740835 RepID=A0A8X6JHH4_TRICU|nr:hypothetical protein TNCT_134911 [Trichonephila clavata]